jgi:hypothetical protein
MNIQNISVHIRYSKPLADGSYKTVELAAEGSLAPGEDWHKAEVALYHELGQAMKYVFSGNGSGKPALTGPGRPHNGPEKPIQAPARKAAASRPGRPEHWCEEHTCDFNRYEKNGRVWYSHRVGNTKEWCREA